MNKYFLRRGFTLIEILVVVSIIGILTAILSANFTDARVQARNKAIKSELKEVQLALEVYKSQVGNYPVAASYYDLGLLLAPQFIADMPVNTDSSNSNCSITYNDGNNGDYFKLTAARCHDGATGTTDGVQPSDEFARCPVTCSASDCGGVAYDTSVNTFYESYAVYSFGGQCE